jgi:hypothetical protein
MTEYAVYLGLPVFILVVIALASAWVEGHDGATRSGDTHEPSA